MDWRDRDARLIEIFDRYGVNGSQFLGLQAEIEELMDQDRADAYYDGMNSEGSSGLYGCPQ